MHEHLLDREELDGARQDAEDDLRLWRKRAYYSAAAFILSCAATYPFLYGHSLYVYWDSFGKYLVILSTALFLPFVICVGITISCWMSLRNVRRGRF